MPVTEVTLPDIGDFDAVEIIEVLVSAGDQINKDDSIITLESDKASMEIPSPVSGVVKDIHVNLGDHISKGSPVINVETQEEPSKTDDVNASNESSQSKQDTPITEVISVPVPDIGDFDAVEIIEVLVSAGDQINKDDSIITLESDKASMEIPSPQSGKVISVKVELGEQVSKGDSILELEVTHNQSPKTQTQPEPVAAKPETQAPKEAPKPQIPTSKQADFDPSVSNRASGQSHASPSVRKLARELGVDLSKVVGSGQKGRILDADLKAYVKQILTSGNLGSAIPAVPVIDFSKFGDIETQPLSRINKISGKHLTACWLNIPHVTQFDEANIDQIEAFRQEQKAKGVKLTPLVFIMKAVVQTLKQHPRFNASLDEAGENLIIKKYFNLGIAMDTPNGLVVPVIKEVDQKSLTDLATELAETSARAREGKLSPKDMQGAGFSISSLGGIGGTQFTPIVNAPEVAILGVSRTQTKPIWDGKNFVPTLTLPLALSYDHRVIDGAQGARFMSDLSATLEDIRQILL